MPLRCVAAPAGQEHDLVAVACDVVEQLCDARVAPVNTQCGQHMTQQVTAGYGPVNITDNLMGTHTHTSKSHTASLSAYCTEGGESG